MVEGGYECDMDDDIQFCSQRAFHVNAVNPYFKGNKKWGDYLRVRWPKMAYKHLFGEGQTEFLIDLKFLQQVPYHGGGHNFSNFLEY